MVEHRDGGIAYALTSEPAPFAPVWVGGTTNPRFDGFGNAASGLNGIAIKLVASKARFMGLNGQNQYKKMAKTALQPVAASRTKPDALYPTWLLMPPLKLPVHNNLPHCADEGSPLTLLAGPQRVEAGWWSGQNGSPCALRDYFLARSEQMGLLWVYQERLGVKGLPAGVRTDASPDWYLHGLFA